ncbi:MAG TPA: DUF433 domain-containing protein [Pyrinomonadaceae bacterium]
MLKFIAMAVTFGTLPKIVRRVDGGALRVGKTRVSLDSVVYAFNRGESAEEIQRDFDTLSLADIHGAIAYYLHNKDQVDKYLAKREADYEKLRERDRARPDHLTRDLLLARKKQSKKDSE